MNLIWWSSLVFLQCSYAFRFSGMAVRERGSALSMTKTARKKKSANPFGSWGREEKGKREDAPAAPLYRPRSENQRRYVDALSNSDTSVVVATGPAGCGKTMFACSAAVQALKEGEIERVILTRPVVSVEEELGFLPGDIVRKMDPWLQPLFDVFLEYYTQREIDDMMANGVLEISPLGFMRGRTFKRVFVIADEMQNSTPGQMLMMLTRVGEGCKMVITGELKQSDLMVNGGRDNGLNHFMQRVRRYDPANCPEIQIVEMKMDDVERSAVVKRVLDIYKDQVSDAKIAMATATADTSVRWRSKEYGDAALIPLPDMLRSTDKK